MEAFKQVGVGVGKVFAGIGQGVNAGVFAIIGEKDKSQVYLV